GWSPDGKLLVLERYRPRPQHGSDLFTIRSDGRGLTRLYGDSGTHNDPAWSPNGRWIVYVRQLPVVPNIHGTSGTIWLLDPRARRARRLTSGRDEYPTWSPDS